MTKILIGLAGAVGVGKTTVADILTIHGYYAYAFADPVKAAVKVAFDLELSWLTDERKNEVHPYWGMTPREMYQKFGTDAMQPVFGADVWVRAMEHRLIEGNHQRAVITDVRPGLNGVNLEADFIRKHGVLVHVEGPSRREQPASRISHSSNGKVPWQYGDLVLDNSGDIRDLQAAVAALLNKLGDRDA